MRIVEGTKALVRGELVEVVVADAEEDLVEVRYVNRGYADRDVSHLVSLGDVKPFEVKKYDRATIYVRSEFGFGFRKIEARDIELEYRPYAQHANAIHVTFTKKGARSRSSFVRTPHSSEFVILEGWGHPDFTGDIFVRSDDEVTQGAVSRHLSCAPEWTTEFLAKFDNYVTDRRDRALLLVKEIGTP
jgi:hypothetical protein